MPLTFMLAKVSQAVEEAQEFTAGTRVEVLRENLPPTMRHFSVGCGVVMYSYAQLYARESPEQANTYNIMFDDGHQSCWYPASTLERF